MRLLCAEAAMLALVRRLTLIALMLLSGAALARADESVAPADTFMLRLSVVAPTGPVSPRGGAARRIAIRQRRTRPPPGE